MSRPDYWKDCTIECERVVTCAVCGRTKAPEGRSAPMGFGYCESGCDGYYQEPRAGHLWPRELAEMDSEDEE